MITGIRKNVFEDTLQMLETNDNIKSYEIVSKNDNYVSVQYTFEKLGLITLEHPVVTLEDICEKILAHKDINLDFCYIFNFDYKKLCKYCNKTVVLQNFSARLAFFDGYTSFQEAIFNDSNISFEFSHFENWYISFNHARFGTGEISFVNTLFRTSSISFDHTFFGDGEVDFDYSVFKSENVSFKESHFGVGNVSFKNACFSTGQIDFFKVRFNYADITFENCDAYNACITFLKCRLVSHENLRFCGIKKLEIIDCIIDGTLIMDSTDSNVNIEQLSFKNTKNLGSIFLNWYTVKRAISKYKDDKFTNNSEQAYKDKANQLKILKVNFHNLGEYDYEDEAFVEYMRYSRKSKKGFKRLSLILLDLIGGYGTKPLHVLFTMFIVVLGFAFIFCDSHTLTTGNDAFTGLTRGLYFSTTTFFTIGYGDIYPTNGGAAIAAGIEGFLGLFLMSYFTVSIVRKTLR